MTGRRLNRDGERTETDAPPEPPPDSAQPRPPKYPSLSRLDFAKLPKGSRLSAVTFPSGKRWEWDEKGNKTEYKPQ